MDFRNVGINKCDGKIKRKGKMKRLVRLGFIVLGILLLGISSSQALTIDFNDLEAAGSGFTEMTSYSFGGFTISDTEDTLNSFWAPQHSNSWYFGSPNLFYIHPYSSDFNFGVILTSTAGKFTLNSIDLHGINAGLQTVNFLAFDENQAQIGSATSLSFNNTAWYTLNFGSDFQNVYSVRWQQFDPYYSFDNIVLNNPNVVPEPVSFLLYGLGGLTLGLIKKLRKKKA